MEIQKLHHDGVSVSEIARQLNLVTMAEGGPGAGVCPLRDCAGRAGADGLGAFRQPGWTASLWLCTHAVLVADAVCRVHPAAGCGDP
jgi:hypothetical protein